MKLHEALEFAANKKVNEDGNTQSMEFFLKSFDRGLRPFRKILQYTEIARWKIENLNMLKTFVDLCWIERPSKKTIQQSWGEWNRYYFQNRCREFLFKFRNNTPFVHVFFYCLVSDKYLSEIERRLFPEIGNRTENGMIDYNLFINAVISLSNFLIWECKLRKEIVPVGTLIENLLASVKKWLYISSALRTVKNKIDFFVCRHISDPPW
jgi:hypothetical protein